MTRDKYFNMMEQLGKEPIEEEIPVAFEDLEEEAQVALNIFNSLGNRVYPEIGYVGKDYTNLLVLIEIYQVEDKELLLEILTWLDNKTIEKASKALKKEYAKLKRQSSV